MPYKEIAFAQEHINTMAEILRRKLIGQPFDIGALIDELQKNGLPYTYLINHKRANDDAPLTRRDLIIIGAFCDLTANGNRDPELALSVKGPMMVVYPENQKNQPELLSTDPQQIIDLLETSRFAGGSDGRRIIFGWL